MRTGPFIWLLATLAVVGCKKDEAPASEAPKSQAAPGAEEPAAAPSAASPPESAPERAAGAAPAPAPTVGSTKEEPKADKKSKDALATEPTNLVEAEKLLETATLDLNKLAGAKTGKAAGATPLATGDPRCPEACKAMTSLRRAAAAVCRLAGDTNERCARAKNIVKDSESRVAVCKCEQGKD